MEKTSNPGSSCNIAWKYEKDMPYLPYKMTFLGLKDFFFFYFFSISVNPFWLNGKFMLNLREIHLLETQTF